MTQTIRVEQLLRETVQSPYCDLVTRPTGRAVRSSIQQRLTALHTTLTLLDFSEVGLVDFSCADEVIAKLLLEPVSETAIVLQGLREEQLEAIEHVLEHHDLATLVRDPERGIARIVGRASPDLRTAFFALQQHGPAGADGLARLTGWAADHAEAVLAALARLRLVIHSTSGFMVPFGSEPLSP
ncbi:MAG TPA: hypothetical protein VLD58_14275 [Gemmatimonadales bacterium]|nr:hypothetical protein [Gemmatimonadales bacterium]